MTETNRQMNMNPQAPQAPPSRPQHPLANYQFSADELRVLKECNAEAFLQRSLPIGTGFGLAAYYGVKKGFFTANAKYGAVPKVLVSVIVGYFLGKVSYQQRCAEKIMRLPNSKLGEVLRHKKKGGLYDSLTPNQGLGAGLGLAPFSTPAADLYSDEGIKSSKSNPLDLDTERPAQKGLDDTYRPTLDTPVITYDDEIPVEQSKQSVSYDDLRKQNREEYQKKLQSPLHRPLPPESPPVMRAAERSADETPRVRERRNQYGDIWSQ